MWNLWSKPWQETLTHQIQHQESELVSWATMAQKILKLIVKYSNYYGEVDLA